MSLFVLRKLILQMRMPGHPVGLDVWCLVRPFVYFHTSHVRTAKALARLRGCPGSPEPWLVAYVISTIISCAGSYNLSVYIEKYFLTRLGIFYTSNLTHLKVNGSWAFVNEFTITSLMKCNTVIERWATLLIVTVMILSFQTDTPGQTVQTQIRLLLEEQSDQGLHCLQFPLHLLDALL